MAASEITAFAKRDGGIEVHMYGVKGPQKKDEPKEGGEYERDIFKKKRSTLQN